MTNVAFANSIGLSLHNLQWGDSRVGLSRCHKERASEGCSLVRGWAYLGHGRHKWQKQQQLHMLAARLLLNAGRCSQPSVVTAFASEGSTTCGSKIFWGKNQKIPKYKPWACHLLSRVCACEVTCRNALLSPVCKYNLCTILKKGLDTFRFWCLRRSWDQSLGHWAGCNCSSLGPLLRERSCKCYQCYYLSC